MRTLPAGMQACLDSGATTLCQCWRVIRADGARLGFTDHDEALSFDGDVFEACSGAARSALHCSGSWPVSSADGRSGSCWRICWHSGCPPR